MTHANTPNAHNYYFNKFCQVDPDTLDEVTRQSREATNAKYLKSRGKYIYDTYAAVHRTEEGLPYSFFYNRGDSDTDLVLIYNPFGTPIAPSHSAEDMATYVENRRAQQTPENIQPNDANKLLQSRFLYDTLNLAGITDAEGRPLPVLTISAPSLDHKSPLTLKERSRVARGNFTPFALRGLDITRQKGYGRIYAAGYSLGTIAASAVRIAGEKDIDVLAGCYVGDAPNFRNRHPRQPIPIRILLPYMLDSLGSGYEGDWIADGPEPRVDIARNGESYDAIGHWFKNGNLKVNVAIGKGLSHKDLPQTLDYMNEHKIPTAISWSESKLMKGFENFISNNTSAEQLAINGLLALFCARRTPHISGENPIFLTDVMLRSIRFAQQTQKTSTSQ